MFRTTAEAEGEGLDPVKLVSTPLVIYDWPRQGGTYVVFPQCYTLLCPCVYGLEQCGHLNNSRSV